MARTYNSSRRSLQAAQTRAEVLRAGLSCFASSGWAGTTVSAIAAEAGVSVETVYKGFGSKKGLLRAVMDVAVVGDDEPVPYVERPEFRRLGEGTLRQRIERSATVVADIHERSAGVWQAIAEAAGADDEVARWRIELEQNRRIDVGRSTELVLGQPPDDGLVTALWVLYSPEAYLKLVGDAGLTRAEYEACLVDTTGRLASSLGLPLD